MKHFAFLIGCFVFLAACSSAPTPTPAPTVDVGAVQTQAAVAIFATQTASVPTATATLASTATLQASATPDVSNTPESTSTPLLPTLDPNEAVRLLDWTNYTSGSGNYIYIDGEIQNATTEPMGFIEITVKLLDADQKLVATDSGYADTQRLGPGDKTTFKIMTPNRQNIARIVISNITWQWAGEGTPRALDLPTLTLVPPSATPTAAPTPVIVPVGQSLSAKGLTWAVSRVEQIKTLESSFAPDTRTARGMYLIVLLDLSANTVEPLREYRGFAEVVLRDAKGKEYLPVGFPQSMVAQGKYIADPQTGVIYFTRNNNPIPYLSNTIAHDVFVFDVPESSEPLYFVREGYPRLRIQVR